MTRKKKAPSRGTRVRAVARIHRPQGGPKYHPITIQPDQEGSVVTSDDRTITVVFDEPPGNVIQWTGRDKVDQFWESVTEGDPEAPEAMAERLKNSF